MINKKVKDERIIQVQNKILGEAYFVTVLLLFISILVKAYVMKCDYTNYITELIIIILSAIYIAVRSMMCGNNLMDTSKRNKTLCVLGAFGASIVITAINPNNAYHNFKNQNLEIRIIRIRLIFRRSIIAIVMQIALPNFHILPAYTAYIVFIRQHSPPSDHTFCAV